jgi:hypothetical protein
VRAEASVAARVHETPTPEGAPHPAPQVQDRLLPHKLPVRAPFRTAETGTESRSSVTSSPDGIRRCTGSAAALPASTTTFTVAKGSEPYLLLFGRGMDAGVPESSGMY